MNDHLGNVHVLMLHVGGYCDLRKIKKLFYGGKYGRNWVSRMVRHFLDNVLALEEFMWNQLTLVFLEASENVSHGVIDGFRCRIVDTRKICLLDCGNDLLHKDLLYSYHFEKRCTSLVCVILMFEFMQVSVTSSTMSGPGQVG